MAVQFGQGLDYVFHEEGSVISMNHVEKTRAKQPKSHRKPHLASVVYFDILW